MKNRTRMLKRKKETYANRKLTSCRTCENPISKNAEVCPHCGELSPLNAKEYVKTGLIKFIAILVMAFLVYKIVPEILGNIGEQATKTLNNNK